MAQRPARTQPQAVVVQHAVLDDAVGGASRADGDDDVDHRLAARGRGRGRRRTGTIRNRQSCLLSMRLSIGSSENADETSVDRRVDEQRPEERGADGRVLSRTSVRHPAEEQQRPAGCWRRRSRPAAIADEREQQRAVVDPIEPRRRLARRDMRQCVVAFIGAVRAPRRPRTCSGLIPVRHRKSPGTQRR